MVMNKRLQVQKIRSAIKARGVLPDTFDVHAMVDASLSYPENKRNVFSMLMLREDSGRGRASSADLLLKAIDVNSRRKPRAQFMETKNTARKVFDGMSLTSAEFSKWKKRPNRYDIYGVDEGY